MQQLFDVGHFRVQMLHACGEGAGQGRVVRGHRRLPAQNREFVRVPLLLA